MFSFGMKVDAVENAAPIQNKEIVRAKALLVLEQKCNACHVKKKRIVFTSENMSSQARPIHYQVFVKERMPKGKVKLTDYQRKDLSKWLWSLGCQISF